MKRFLLASLALLSSCSLFLLSAQEEKEVKKGWSFGILPAASYNNDNGLQLGAFGDVYYYGDGSTYPDPLHKICWEASHFLKGKTRLYLAYDSKYLVPGMRVNASVTYLDDPMYNFWGFNGPAALTDYDLWANRETMIDYYGMGRSMFRILANVQGRIAGPLNWAAGINFWNWKLGDMRTKTGYDLEQTLYRDYLALGAISPEEKDGGNSLEINAGLVFDTRDIEAAPSRGVWAEAYLNGNVIGQRYLKACTYFRHYIDIPVHMKAGDPVFAYRLAWQQTIAGETPFYMIQNVPLLVQRNMISEGFGSSNTIRCIRENRILAEGMAWMNAEVRVKLVNFKLFNQYFYVAVNPFFDAGVVTKTYRPDAFFPQEEPQMSRPLGEIYDSARAGDVITSAGAGLKVAMNQNFVVSLELGKTFYKPMDVPLWINIGTNYQF